MLYLISQKDVGGENVQKQGMGQTLNSCVEW